MTNTAIGGSKTVDYSSVTEITGYNISRDQLQRLFTRYYFASRFCKDKDVLEVACGSGQGLGYLARYARRVVGGDFDENIVARAKEHYGDRVDIRQFDAQNLPFNNESFDVVICYEALYYFEEPGRFIQEARRILQRGGVLIICLANKDWTGFNPSPYSYNYFSVPELHALLREVGFEVSMFADSPVDDRGVKNRIINFMKWAAVRMHLIPRTMKGKETLKRLFCGKLCPLPPEITDGMAAYTPPVQISHERKNTQFKVVFAVGHVK